MRIDSALPPSENVQSQNVTSRGPSTHQTPSLSAGSTQDQAQLSIDSNTIQQLQARLSQVPDVRQDRVNALRQAVNNGSYQVSDQQLSDAIASDMFAGIIM
jgi:negative regulator of flagellin synthesis FlgM